MMQRTRIGHGQGGVVLLEVLVSILIFSIGILALVGLQAAAIASVGDAKYRVDASQVAQQEIGLMWVDQSNLASHAGVRAVSSLPNGSMAVVVNGSDVTVTVTWQPPDSATVHTYVSYARIYQT